jgi:hypothetical protein
MNYNLFGDKYIEVPNEPEALVINYYLRADVAADTSLKASITVTDATKRTVATVQGTRNPGLNRVTLSLGGGGRGQGRGGAPGGLPVGDYTVSLLVANDAIPPALTKPARVRDRIR